MMQFHILKDGTLTASTAARKQALDLIHQYQKFKNHSLLRPEFSIIEELASYVKDFMINDLMAMNRTMMLSIDVIPVPTDESDWTFAGQWVLVSS